MRQHSTCLMHWFLLTEIHVCRYFLHTFDFFSIVTTIGDDYDNIAGERQTNKLQCNYIVQKESYLNAQSKVMGKMGEKAAESVSDRHKVNGTVLTIVNTGNKLKVLQPKAMDNYLDSFDRILLQKDKAQVLINVFFRIKTIYTYVCKWQKG